MKAKNFSIFQRITIFVFALTTVLGLLFIGVTYFSTTHFYQASTQLLNKDVAAHIAEFTSPFDGNGLNRQKADSVFHDAMVISPSAEVYFLDTNGNVIYFHETGSPVKLWKLPLENIKSHIVSGGQDYIKGPDPRDPSNPKIFSAAEVKSNGQHLGYIYVVLGSKEYRNVTQMLYSSHVGNLALTAFCFIIIVSILLSLLYINRLQQSFKQMITVLERFEQGDFGARFTVKQQNELAPVTNAFNKMADLLVYNINTLTKTEKDRKDFIANISHDLRPPLSIARGYTETLLIKKEKQGISEQEIEEFIPLVLNKIMQVENMVKQLFELSKMDSVEFKPNKEPFVLSEIVQEAVHHFQITAAEKKVSLKCTQCQYHVWIEADISMMERVIQNLVDNAIKSTPEGGNIQVYLAVENKVLIFNIANEGTPLTEDLLEWINDASTESGLLHKRPAHTGLGLVIVKKIVALHHFSLSAKTDTATGNLFSIRMPVYR